MSGSVTVARGGSSSTLAQDVRRGLGRHPRSLPPRWLYDDAGSALFEAITNLDVYYPYRAERELLEANAGQIAQATGARTLVELGSGTSDKTRILLDALTAHGTLRRFVPLDVAEGTLRTAVRDLSERYRGLQVDALVGDFTLHLSHIPRGDSTLVAFLGGTIGNLYVEERGAFLGSLADSLAPGDWLLLGTDLVKNADRLVAAYDDPGGVTAEFVRNSLRVVNRELGADFDLDAFSYAPLWDARLSRMDLRVRAELPQHVEIPGAGIELDLAAGEEIRIEISTKFRLDPLRAELAAAGFTVRHTYTDGDYALTLAERTADD